MTRETLARVGVASLLVVIAGVAIAAANPWTGLFHDDGIYLVTAKAMASGQGARVISLPGAPPQTKYPPLYPALLAVLWACGAAIPSGTLWFKVPGILSQLVVVALSRPLWRRVVGVEQPILVLAALVVIAFNPLSFVTADLAMSDMLFAALTLAAVLAHERVGPEPPAVRRVVGAALLAVLSAGARQAGLALVVGGLAWAWQHGRRTFSIYGGLVATAIVAWTAGRAQVSPTNELLAYYAGYEWPILARLGAHPAQAVAVVAGNISYLVKAAGTTFFVSVVPPLAWLSACLVAVGSVGLMRRCGRFVQVSVPLYLVLIVVYPFQPSRYLVPLLPLLVVAAARGGLDVVGYAARVAPRWRTVVATFVCLPLALAALATTAWVRSYAAVDPAGPHAEGGIRVRPGWDGFLESFDWVRTHTAPDAVLATAYDPAYFLYSGRRGIRPWIHRPDTYFYPSITDTADIGSPREIRQALDEVGVDYLLLDPLDGYAEKKAFEVLFPQLVREYGARASLVFTSRDGRHRVYRLTRADAAIRP